MKGSVWSGLIVGLLFGIAAVLIAGGTAIYLDLAPDKQTLYALAVAIVVFCAFAGLTTGWMLIDKVHERQTAGRDDVLIRISNSNVRREVFRFLELVALFMIGFLILIGEVTPLAARLLILFVTIELCANAIIDRLEYRQTNMAIKQAILEARHHQETHVSQPTMENEHGI